jgi:hypothetical protein
MKRGLFLLSLLCVLACNQESVIGIDVLPNQDIEIVFTDTVSLSAKSIPGDSLLVFVVGEFGNTNLNTSLIGETDDALFGKSLGYSYFNININGSDSLNFEGATIDSVVLTIPYDTTYNYGPDNASFNFKVYRLSETLEGIDSFYTNDFFDYDPMVLGSRTYSPTLLDTFPVYSAEEDSIIALAPHIRIPITDQNHINELLSSAFNAENDTIFREDNFGYALIAETDDNAYVALNMANESITLRRITVYYTLDDGDKQEYSFAIGAIRSFAFEQDLSGSDAESAINDQSFADSLVLIQGLMGPNIEIDLSSVLALDKGTVNYAEIELNIADILGYDLNEDLPVESFIAFYRNDNGGLSQIEDYSIAFNSSIPSFFDGLLVNDNESYSYKLIITHHILNLINQNIDNTDLVLVPVNKQRTANRSVIYGTANSQNPIKLKLIRSNP